MVALMSFIITPAHLFWAFVVLFIAFIILLYFGRKGYVRMGELNDKLVSTTACNDELRLKINEALPKLEEANIRRKKLQESIDRLILRRDDLMQCLNAARDDQERVACILKLMGEDDQNGI